MTTIREMSERIEFEHLSPFATKSANTKGRKRPVEKCDIRTEFQRDRDKITHCKAFRRLMHKTQVFLSPEGDHYRNRLTHTLEVTQISRTIARALRLNEDLTEAIALSHDLGHTPFGHTGEDALDKILPMGFQHNEQGIRVVELIENGGNGLNLTVEVLDGIVNHRGDGRPSTLEGKIVQLADKIGYINHDIDDAIRAGVLDPHDLPKECTEILGNTSSKRIDFLIRSVISTSEGINDVLLAPDIKATMNKLRQYMFDTVYLSQLQNIERKKIQHVLTEIYDYYVKRPEKLPEEFLSMREKGETLERIVCDYIACMTDRFAIKLFAKVFIPASWDI